MRAAILLAFFNALFLPSIQAQCLAMCRFRLCGKRQRVLVSEANQPLGHLCLNNKTISSANAGDTKFILSRAADLQPLGVKSKTSKLFKFRNSQDGARLFATTFDTRLHRECVAVPIEKYKRGKQVFKGDEKDCIAFRVEIVYVEIELTWNNGDDLDLFVTEPSGVQIFFGRPVGVGRLLKDSGLRKCDKKGGFVEKVVYKGLAAKKGVYKVAAEHTKSCGSKNLRWTLRILVGGKAVREVRGKGGDGSSAVLKGSSIEFTLKV